MSDPKRLMGVYLPSALIARLKVYIVRLYTRGERKNQSEVIQEALETYLQRHEE